MNYRKFVSAVALSTGFVFAPIAEAVVVSKVDSVFDSVDSAFDTKTFSFTGADFTGSSIVTGVTLTVDFSKCGVTVDSTGCTGGSSNPFASEIGFALESAAGTRVALIENNGDDESWETGNFETYDNGSANFSRIVITFDDLGAVLGSLPASGTFAGEESLSAFNGESAIGDWTFFYEDDVGADPLGIHSVTLNIETREASVPAPATFAILGLGLVGLGFSRRKKS